MLDVAMTALLARFALYCAGLVFPSMSEMPDAVKSSEAAAAPLVAITL